MKTVSLEPNYEVDVLCEKGDSCKAHKQYRQAMESFEKALDVINKSERIDKNIKAHVLDELGCTCFWLRDHKQAEAHYLESIACSEQDFYPEHASLTPALDHLAQLYIADGKFEKARPICRRSLAIKEKTRHGAHSDTFESMRMCAIVDRHLGNLSDAENLLKKGITILENATIGPFEEFLWEMAKVKEAQGKTEEAVELYQRAIKTFFHRSGRLHRLAQCMMDYAKFQERIEKLSGARDYSNRAIAVEETARRAPQMIEEDETVPRSENYQRVVYPATIFHT